MMYSMLNAYAKQDERFSNDLVGNIMSYYNFFVGNEKELGQNNASIEKCIFNKDNYSERTKRDNMYGLMEEISMYYSDEHSFPQD